MTLQHDPSSADDSAVPHALRCYKSEGGRATWLIQRPGDEPTIYKVWPANWKARFKLLLRIAQPQRLLRGTQRLVRAGVATPKPRGSWRIERGQIIVELDHVEGQPATRRLRLSAPSPSAAAELGQAVALIAEAGLLHRDLKLDNVILSEAGDVWIIDTVGVRRCRSRAIASAVMLERLAIQPAEQGIKLPQAIWWPCVTHALRPLSRTARRQAIQHLRQLTTRASFGRAL